MAGRRKDFRDHGLRLGRSDTYKVSPGRGNRILKRARGTVLLRAEQDGEKKKE